MVASVTIELYFREMELDALGRLMLMAHEVGAEVQLNGEEGGGEGRLTVNLRGEAGPMLAAAGKLSREAEHI